jgi:hypothetical protein
MRLARQNTAAVTATAAKAPLACRPAWQPPSYACSMQETVMSSFRMRIQVAADHTISGVAPADLPPGEHEVVVSIGPVVTPPIKPFRMADFPVDNGPWDDSVSLRREDMYGDDGR